MVDLWLASNYTTSIDCLIAMEMSLSIDACSRRSTTIDDDYRGADGHGHSGQKYG